MTLAEATELLTAYFTTQWGTKSALTREGEVYRPPQDGSPWVRFTIRHTDQRQHSLGSPTRKFDRHGLMFVQVFAPLSAGRGAADRLCEEVRGILEAKDIGPGVATFESAVREVGVDGRWLQVNVETGFRYEEQK